MSRQSRFWAQIPVFPEMLWYSCIKAEQRFYNKEKSAMVTLNSAWEKSRASYSLLVIEPSYKQCTYYNGLYYNRPIQKFHTFLAIAGLQRSTQCSQSLWARVHSIIFCWWLKVWLWLTDSIFPYSFLTAWLLIITVVFMAHVFTAHSRPLAIPAFLSLWSIPYASRLRSWKTLNACLRFMGNWRLRNSI